MDLVVHRIPIKDEIPHIYVALDRATEKAEVEYGEYGE